MFDGAQQWILRNLIIEDYIASDYYAVIRSESQYADIQCTHCRFSNITNDNNVEDIHLFDTFGSLHFMDCEFEGIVTESTPMIVATHSHHDTGIVREYSMINCTFNAIVSSWAMFYIDYSWNDVECLYIIRSTICVVCLVVNCCEGTGRVQLVHDRLSMSAVKSKSVHYHRF